MAESVDSMESAEGRLEGRVALVTGASRGFGRAIAAVLGGEGCTVFVTGRTTREEGGSIDGLGGTIEGTAGEVDGRGGVGIPVRCDHTSDEDVGALAERIRDRTGGLDLLVNNVWGGYEGHVSGLPEDPFWELDPDRAWRGMFEAGLRAHLRTTARLVPLMLERPGGLIVTTVAWLDGDYLGNLHYDVAKAATIRMAEGMARELRDRGIASVALVPGFMRTERVMEALGEDHPMLERTESPEYGGRAVAALASDPEVLARTGSVLEVGELAREYGFTDVDGTRPPPFRP